jgi:hypothetical protein
MATGSRDGSFVIDRLAPGSYRIQGILIGGGAMGTMTPSVTVDVRANETARADIELAARGKATVKLFVARDGKPVDRAIVMITPSSADELDAEGLEGMTMLGPESEGRAELKNVPPGSNEFCAMTMPRDLESAADDRASVDVGEMGRGCITLDVPSSGEIRGTIKIESLFKK